MNIIIKYGWLVLLIAVASAATFAATPKIQLQKIAAAYLADYGLEEHASAVSITVYSPALKDPISVYSGTVAFNGQQRTIDASSLFQIGSIGKSYVAALILRLADNPKNHLQLDDPIDTYFPDYKNWHSVTIRDLLNMTSGIPDYLKDPEVLAAYAKNPYQAVDLKPWIDRMYRQPLLFSPGKKFDYSNTNYILLSMLIEKLTGHSLAEEINTNFVKPLQLNHTFYVTHAPNAALSTYLVHGYQYEKGFLNYIPLGTDVTDYSLSYLQAAGGVLATSRDVAKWMLALFTPGRVLTAVQLKQLTTIFSATGEEVDELTPSNPNGYGLGISMQYSAKLNTTIYIYQGMTLGFRSMYVYVPTLQLLIVVTVNSSFDGKENHLLGLINEVGNLFLV